MKSLKFFRIGLAIVFVLAISFIFLDVSGYAAENLEFFTHIQFVPAFLSLNILAIVLLLALTLIFGRIYCSVICPLGVYQDFVSWLHKYTSTKTRRKVGLFSYKPAKTVTRSIILGAFLIIVLLGLLNIMAISIGALIEPYSAFGRMVTALVSPVYDAGNNYLADWSVEQGNYDFTPVSRTVPTLLLIIAAITFLVVTAFAWKGGRAYCNTICPVGTLLGFMSRYSWLKIRIDMNKCNSCGSCQRHCKASCIDSRNHAIDSSRCVACMDCIGKCRHGALSFRPRRKGEVTYHPSTVKANTENTPVVPHADKGRRQFMATLGLLTGAAVVKSAQAAVGKVTDGGLTPLKDKQSPARKTRIVPPGAISQAHINAHCVGCQLCIQACPNGLLTMSTELGTMLQPKLDYISGYCEPECTKCSNVCPAGVFTPLDEILKSSWKVGTAVVDTEACLSANGTDSCGNCARHCPAGAISMVDLDTGNASNHPEFDYDICISCGACVRKCPFDAIEMVEDQPVVNTEICVGCGACERACHPKAITMVSGKAKLSMPYVDENICIGCGACEFHCPVGTVASMEADCAAIHVEGVVPQRKI